MLDNWEPLSPVRMLERAAEAFADRTAIVDGDTRLSYAEFALRARHLTGALRRHDVQPGDRVAALCANSHVMLELHFGVPLCGAVLVPLNTRLAEEELAHILTHAGATLLVATAEFAVVAEALGERLGVPVLVASGPGSPYEQALQLGEESLVPLEDERSLLSINYTSGTTGRPKGVMYHHRGAYLQALAMTYHTGLGPGSTYLWTLPMFHCHGWCFPWAVTGVGATHHCMRSIDVGQIWLALRSGATHLSAAPTVLGMIADHVEADADPLEETVQVSTGGAPPSPALLARMRSLNIEVTHLYGLTETFGPVIVNQWQPEWYDLDTPGQAQMTARQGIPNVISSQFRVEDAHGNDVPADGDSIGELLIRGNNVMLGYYKDEEATRAATSGGWFRTGDLAVAHPDGYVEVRDRLKDVIVSGGENIASVEVERVLEDHPDVLEAAVVAQADERWGQVPIAFVSCRQDAELTEDELKQFVRSRLAGFKVPKHVTFGSLPHTSTGKLQKNLLRSAGSQGVGT
jgi:fatty-acyl-CoA synthase